MISFGVVSKLDKNGGLKLPKMLMGLCAVEIGDNIEIHLENESLVMRKYPPSCIFCGSEKDLKEYMSISFCRCCADELRNYKRI